jgi:hypothetical protein
MRLFCGDTPAEEVKGGFRSTSKTLGVLMIWVEDIRFVSKGKTSKQSIR